MCRRQVAWVYLDPHTDNTWRKLDTRADSASCLPTLIIPLPPSDSPADTFPWPGKLSSVSLNLLLPYVVLRYENKYLATQTADASSPPACVCDWCRCLCLNLNFLRPYFMRLPMCTFKKYYIIFPLLFFFVFLVFFLWSFSSFLLVFVSLLCTTFEQSRL